jgi:hypothetical protein
MPPSSRGCPVSPDSQANGITGRAGRPLECPEELPIGRPEGSHERAMSPRRRRLRLHLPRCPALREHVRDAVDLPLIGMTRRPDRRACVSERTLGAMSVQ